MILLQQNKKKVGRQGGKCQLGPMTHRETGGIRRELRNRGRGIQDHVDKSMGIVILITEISTKINSTESF